MECSDSEKSSQSTWENLEGGRARVPRIINQLCHGSKYKTVRGTENADQRESCEEDSNEKKQTQDSSKL